MSALATIDFHGDTLEAVKDENGTIWVSLKRCCENLGVDDYTQARKLKGKEWASTSIMLVDLSDNSKREVTMIDLATLPGWLFSMDSRKVSPAIKDKLVKYQRECAKVLADHFLGAKQPEQAPEQKPIASNKIPVAPAGPGPGLTTVLSQAVESPDPNMTPEQYGKLREDVAFQVKTSLFGHSVNAVKRMRDMRYFHLLARRCVVDAVTTIMLKMTTGEEVTVKNGEPVYFAHQFFALDAAIEFLRHNHDRIKMTPHPNYLDNFPRSHEVKLTLKMGENI